MERKTVYIQTVCDWHKRVNNFSGIVTDVVILIYYNVIICDLNIIKVPL
jgi:hypothetical protein